MKPLLDLLAGGLLARSSPCFRCTVWPPSHGESGGRVSTIARTLCIHVLPPGNQALIHRSSPSPQHFTNLTFLLTFRSRIIQKALSHTGFVGVGHLLVWAARGFRTGTRSQTSDSQRGGLGSGPPVSEAPGCGCKCCRLSYTRFGESHFWGMEEPETQPM